MDCPHCHSCSTRRLKRTTDLGYAVLRCRGCGRTFNERTGTPFNFVEVPTEIVFQVLLFRVRYKLSYRDMVEMFLLRGFTFTHETVRDWEERFTAVWAQELRAKRRGKVGKVWYVDETYVKVGGRWCYLYRAIIPPWDFKTSRPPCVSAKSLMNFASSSVPGGGRARRFRWPNDEHCFWHEWRSSVDWLCLYKTTEGRKASASADGHSSSSQI